MRAGTLVITQEQGNFAMYAIVQLEGVKMIRYTQKTTRIFFCVNPVGPPERRVRMESLKKILKLLKNFPLEPMKLTKPKPPNWEIHTPGEIDVKKASDIYKNTIKENERTKAN